MGSNDIPPPDVPSFFMPTLNAALQGCGALWTICYILMLRESRRTRTYGMPLFALAVNFAWEIVNSLFVCETTLETAVFGTWMVVDIGLVFYTLKYGRQEWGHAPFVAKNLGTIFFVLLFWCTLGQYAFAKWWIDNEIGKKEGKFYHGVVGPDTTELAFWTTAFAQTHLGVMSLVQLLVRQHTGGVSWGICGFHYWWTGFWGIGCYFWMEANAYFLTPFAIFLWGTSTVVDLIYPFVFYHIRKNEEVHPDGRKTSGVSLALGIKKTR